MLYQVYQARQDLLAPLRIAADLSGAFLQEPLAGPFGKFFAAASRPGPRCSATPG